MTAWLAAITGLFVGATATLLWFLGRRAAQQAELINARTRTELLDEMLARQAREFEEARAEMIRLDGAREDAECRVAVLEEQLRSRVRELESLEAVKRELATTFKATGAEALQANNQQFITLAEAQLKPFKELLAKQERAVGEIEQKREAAYARLDEQVKAIASSHSELRQATGRLVGALRKSDVRGKWGEMQLRNAVELAGMTAHCDFDEQVTVWSGEQSSRPDMVVNIPGGGVIVVDAKVALDGYLDALTPDADRAAQMDRHARHVETHAAALAHKRYWDHFARTPKLVVMFMPLESALVAALEVRPELHAAALQQHVLIATPTLLIAVLRAVAYGWQQEDVAANARQIGEVGKELYERLRVFAGHFSKVGERLGGASRAYNEAVGSAERSLLAGARKLKDLHATTEADLEPPAPIEIEIRPIVAPELKPLPAGGQSTVGAVVAAGTSGTAEGESGDSAAGA